MKISGYPKEEAARHLAAIIESSDDAIVSKSLEGIIRSWNKGAERIFGYGADEVIGKSITILIPPERQSEEPAILARMKKGERIEHFKTIRVRKNGERIPISLTISPVQDASGKIIGVSKIARDISLRIDADKMKQHMAAIVESSDDAIISKDLHSVITSWNKGAERIFGYKADEIIGKSVLTLIPPDLQDEEVKILARIKKGERIEHYETIRMTKDGRTLNVSLSISSIMNEWDEIIGTSKIVRDITEKRILEEKLKRAKEEAERANRSKSTFLANMSHELRTPIAAILGFTEILSDRTISEDEQNEATHIIKRNGEMLLKLVNDVLDISRIEADRMDLEYTNISLKSILDELGATIGLKAREKGLIFKTIYNLESGISDLIVGDSMKVRQILLNLANNAVKFTEKGQVQITLEITPSPNTPGKVAVTFEVKDTGPGIPEDRQSKLFQPFSQADSSLSRKYGGVGLGLFISKRLAQVMGGDLSLKHCNSQGCSFVFRFEADLQKIIPPSNLPSTGNLKNLPLQAFKILLAEDAPDNALLLSKNLKHLGAEVDIASHGREAAQKALEKEYDVILMDIQMPVMDGYEAVKNLRDKQYAVPIVALTAHAMREEREKALASGFNGYVTKPIDKPLLIELLNSLKK